MQGDIRARTAQQINAALVLLSELMVNRAKNSLALVSGEFFDNKLLNRLFSRETPDLNAKNRTNEKEMPL